MLPDQPCRGSHRVSNKSLQYLERQRKPRKEGSHTLVPVPSLVVRRQPQTVRSLRPAGNRSPRGPALVNRKGHGVQQHVPAENAFWKSGRVTFVGQHGGQSRKTARGPGNPLPCA